MSEALQNFTPHENLARDAYWGAPESFVPVIAAGLLATAETGVFAHMAGTRDIVTSFRKLYTWGSGFTGRSDYVPDNQLPVLDDSVPGVLQVVHDERVTFKDPKSRAAERAADAALAAEKFDELALDMEQPGTLHGAVMCEVLPGVLVGRCVWYMRGVHLPFGVRPPQRYAGLRHAVVRAGHMAAMVNPMRPGDLTPEVSGHVDARSVRIATNDDSVKLSRVAVTMHLRPGDEQAGLGKRGRIHWGAFAPKIA